MGTYDPMPADGAPAWGPWARNAVGGLAGRVSTLELGGGGGGGGSGASPAVLQVISADAPAWMKVGGDSSGTLGKYLCDGTADDVQIQAALDRAAPLQSRNAGMPASAEQAGKVLLSGGQFNAASTVRTHTGVWFSGSGWLTELRAVGLGTAPLLALSAASDHICHVSDMWLNGNFATGGTGNALDFDMTASGNTSTYPDMNPDGDHLIHDLLINGLSNGTTRTGLHLWASGTANNRGSIVDRIQIRNCSADGISYEAASDSYISNTHIGGVTGVGHRVGGGNTKLTNVKSFFCDDTGFLISSGRAIVHGLESQDNATGVNITGADTTGAGWLIDSSSADGLVLGATHDLTGVTVLNRTGGRYNTQTNGVRYAASSADSVLVGRITPAGITNPFVGTPGARNFVRMPDGTTLHTAG